MLTDKEADFEKRISERVEAIKKAAGATAQIQTMTDRCRGTLTAVKVVVHYNSRAIEQNE